MYEYEQSFQSLKVFLSSLPILTRPIEGSPLYLYLFVTDHELSSVLVQEKDKVEKNIYFIRKVFRVIEDRYHKI